MSFQAIEYLRLHWTRTLFSIIYYCTTVYACWDGSKASRTPCHMGASYFFPIWCHPFVQHRIHFNAIDCFVSLHRPYSYFMCDVNSMCYICVCGGCNLVGPFSIELLILSTVGAHRKLVRMSSPHYHWLISLLYWVICYSISLLLLGGSIDLNIFYIHVLE